MSDNVNNPAHYQFANGVEVIDLTEQMNFNLGNVIKYVARSGRKTQNPLEDLRKAEFYLQREIARLVDVSGLPEGLEYDESQLFYDKEDWLWRWDGETWLYYDAGDDDWYKVEGTPSEVYAPFRKADLWLNG